MPRAQETLNDKENSIMQGETSTFISNNDSATLLNQAARDTFAA
jgi:hypothetical protein